MRWYRDKIRSLGMLNVTPDRIMMSDLGRLGKGVSVGNMYLYHYDPKLKDKKTKAGRYILPWYDIFPLVVPFRMNPDGFHGFNLHYLKPTTRMMVLKMIIEIESNGGLEWAALQAVAGESIVEHCVKRYLYTHVDGKAGFLKINKEDWKTTIMLPLERFQRASKYTVMI